jgi:Transposase DDE domain group 1
MRRLPAFPGSYLIGQQLVVQGGTGDRPARFGIRVVPIGDLVPLLVDQPAVPVALPDNWMHPAVVVGPLVVLAPAGGGELLPILPLHGFNQNQIWCELVAMACELTAWMQMLALDGATRAWAPKRLRLRLFSAAGRLVRGGRRLRLRIAATWPWATQITTAITRLQALAPG